MSTKNHPSVFNCYKAALPDEPMFVMLARDPAAPETLRHWANQRRLLGKVATEDDQDRIAEALALASRMENWRLANLDPLGGTPTWRLPRPEGEWGAPVEYVPAERDGEEAVRLNIEWLKSLLTGLESGETHPSETIALLRLAMNSPDRRRAFDLLGEFGHQKVYVEHDCPEFMREQMTERLRTARYGGPVDSINGVPTTQAGEERRWDSIRINKLVDTAVEKASYSVGGRERLKRKIADLGYERLGDLATSGNYEALASLERFVGSLEADHSPVLGRLRNVIEKLDDGRLPTPHDLYRAVAKSDNGGGWDYECIGIGVTDLKEIEKMLLQGDSVIPSGSIRIPGHADPQTLDQIAEVYRRASLPQPTVGTKPTMDTKPDDLAHAPEVPPHRFSQFIKGERYAYARGLEVNPTHLPTALDAMAKDGWNLLAIFGQTDSANVGFIFERYEPPLYRIEMGKPMFDGFAAETKPQSPQMDAYEQGIPLDDIDVTGYGRGLQP